MLYVVVPYLAVTMVFVVLQRKLMYRPTVADDLRADAVALDLRSVRDVRIQTPDGDVLRGWLLKAAERNGEQTAPLVVYFPGNSLNRYERVDDLREIAAGGYDVLIFDYRGFGDSSGSPTEQKLTSDAQLIWSYAREELGYEERRIVVFGESLGGAVALSLWSAKVANPPQPAAVILNATFVSMPRTVAWHYPLFPFQYLLLDRWPSDVRIPRVSVPMIVFHGTADEMIPVAHGQELAQLSRNARFIEIPEAPHNSIPQHRLRTELHRLRGAMVESGE
jgi:hypothetical protein